MATNVQEVIGRAKQLISERKHQDAVRACRRVLLSRPDEVPVRLLLAQALLALGRHDEVRIEMQSLTRKAPNVAAAYRLLGESHIRGGRAAQAADALKTALKLDPNDDEARDLLEEVGEVDLPPRAETIDRWFKEEPTELEADVAAYVPAEDDFEDATQEAEPSSLDDEFEPPTVRAAPAFRHAPDSVQLDPGYEAEASREHDLDGVPTHTPAGATRPRKKRTMMGMPAAPPPRAAPPPARRPKRTMMGMPAAAPAPLPPAPPRASRSGPPPPPAAPPLEPKPKVPSRIPSVAPPPFEDRPKPGFGGQSGTQELDLDEVLESETGTDELDELDLAPVFHKDPYEDLEGGLPPLEGEPTQAKTGPSEAAESVPPAPGLGTVGREPWRARPMAPEPFEALDEGLPPLEGEPTSLKDTSAEDFDDLQTRARPAVDVPEDIPTSRGLRAPRPVVGPPDDIDEEELATTQARAAYEPDGFPEDDLDTGLPPLEGEPTHARSAPADPFADRPAPDPFAPPPVAPAPAPAARRAAAQVPTHRPPPPRDLAPSPQPSGPQPAVSPDEATPATKRRKLKTPEIVALAGIPVLLVVILVAVVRWYSASEAEEEVAAATRQATDDGLWTSLRAAIDLDEEGGQSLPRRARLYATAALEHGEADAAPYAEEIAGLLDDEERTTPDAVVARTYLALRRGDLERANLEVEQVRDTDLDGEGGFARAKVLLRRNQVEAARRSATQAQALRSTSPRYAALLAETLAMDGDVSGALQTLEATSESNPVVLLARADALLREDRFDDAHETLERVRTLEDTLSQRQRAEARLLGAHALVGRGDASTAREWAQRAETEAPSGDEDFGMRLARVYLLSSDGEAAKRAFEALPEQTEREAERAILAAEVYLASGDRERAREFVERAGDSNEVAYARGRIAESDGDWEAAVRAYSAAENIPRFRMPARLRRARIRLQEGEPGEVVELLEELVGAHPAEPQLVSLLVDAHLELNRADRAGRVVRDAKAASDGTPAPEIRLAEARVALQSGQARQAQQILEQLAEERPNDPALQVSLGEAARQSGNWDGAETAYRAAIEAGTSGPAAATGLALVALARGDLEAAVERVDAAVEAGLSGNRKRELEGRIAVLQGRGAEAVETLRPLARSGDAQILADLGHAYLQAESLRNAGRFFLRAIREDEDNVDALLGMARMKAFQGYPTRGETYLDRADAAIEENDLGARYQAWALATRAYLEFQNGREPRAAELAREAIQKDEHCGEAHFVLGLVEQRRSHFVAAAEGVRPPPDAFAEIAISYPGNGEDRCRYGQRYLSAAPNGDRYRVNDVRDATSRCR